MVSSRWLYRTLRWLHVSTKPADLQNGLLEGGWQINAIKIKVQVTSKVEKEAPPKQIAMSDSALRAFASLEQRWTRILRMRIYAKHWHACCLITVKTETRTLQSAVSAHAFLLPQYILSAGIAVQYP
jgi:hypothetical protein